MSRPFPPMPSATPDFDRDLRQSLGELRDALAEVLESVQANLETPHTMTRAFGLDKSLAWKLARVVRETDPYVAVLDVPGSEAFRGFVRQMLTHNAPRPKLHRLEQAVERFGEVISLHCGDRATLEMMAASATGGSERQLQHLETFRRMLFRGASATFGVQTQTQYSVQVIAPRLDKPARLDFGTFGGFAGFRRLRGDVTWAISTPGRTDADGSPVPLDGIRPLDPASASADGAPLLPSLCSSPVPQIDRVVSPRGRVRFQLPAGPIGMSNAINLGTGWLLPDFAERYRTPHDPLGEHFCHVNTPAESVVFDLYLHRLLDIDRHVTHSVYQALPGAVTFPNGPRDLGKLIIAERPETLTQPEEFTLADVAQYTPTLSLLMATMGHRPTDFVAVRLRLRYPPIPSTIVFRYELPEKP